MSEPTLVLKTVDYIVWSICGVFVSIVVVWLLVFLIRRYCSYKSREGAGYVTMGVVVQPADYLQAPVLDRYNPIPQPLFKKVQVRLLIDTHIDQTCNEENNKRYLETGIHVKFEEYIKSLETLLNNPGERYEIIEANYFHIQAKEGTIVLEKINTNLNDVRHIVYSAVNQCRFKDRLALALDQPPTIVPIDVACVEGHIRNGNCRCDRILVLTHGHFVSPQSHAVFNYPIDYGTRTQIDFYSMDKNYTKSEELCYNPNRFYPSFIHHVN